ncbi:MAG: peptidoglycan DD-metalloendopeptidase family protein [Arsenophonus sp.]|nr:MAG: peptidoglycan DD-metalloendopeptidase family protein [Arsenophonus sp.]
MNFNAQEYVIRLAFIYIFTTSFLLGCSKMYQRSAPIISLNDQNNYLTKNKCSSILENKNNVFSYQENPSFLFNNIQKTSLKKKIYKKKVLNNFFKNRNYENIPKGKYKKDFYIVQKGDTLFYISWITGIKYHEIMKYNNIINPNYLYVGQILKINNFSNFSNKNNYFFSEEKNQSKINKLKNNKNDISYSKKNKKGIDIHWIWPTNGEVVEKFSDLQGGNKGIDIAGKLGQPIFSSAKGKVVYIGSVLRGYGNLIIIKHNSDYLSAYAHNNLILVTEEEEVQEGQEIATMGNSDSNSVKLHFEIRYKGKSVDPLRYLPNK